MNENKPYTLHLGNCIDVLKTLPDNSVDSIVTDPPYELGFMGKKWDSTGIANNVDMWSECFRVLKHGGHLLSFSGSRTYHRMTCAIEDAGFEIRDQIMWVYGSGFPKSLNISKAIDKAAGAEREVGALKYVVGDHSKAIDKYGFKESGGTSSAMNTPSKTIYDSKPSTDAAKQWDGWGTALKPAHEPICVARKPLSEKTIADNVLKHGTGGLNIDGCRIGTDTVKTIGPNDGGRKFARKYDDNGENLTNVTLSEHTGRFPSNFIHDGSDEVLALFPNNNTGCKPHIINASDETEHNNKQKGWGSATVPKNKLAGFDDGDNLSASRFFYCAKTSKTDRHEGLEEPKSQFKHGDTLRKIENVETTGNNHPTVKPTELMRYLVRLVTPPNGTVLDPFMGSGSTGKACMYEGFKFIGIDMTPEYMKITEARIKFAHENKDRPTPKSKKQKPVVESTDQLGF